MGMSSDREAYIGINRAWGLGLRPEGLRFWISGLELAIFISMLRI